VLAVKGAQVRIGVDAPKGLPVHRKEVYERLKAAARVMAKP
jgi:carbon storage regulator